HYATEIGWGGLVAADPGVAGYWVARTFATTTLGSVEVPASGGPGFAVACAAVARLRAPDRPVLAVVDGPAGHAVEAALDAARRVAGRPGRPPAAWGCACPSRRGGRGARPSTLTPTAAGCAGSCTATRPAWPGSRPTSASSIA